MRESSSGAAGVAQDGLMKATGARSWQTGRRRPRCSWEGNRRSGFKQGETTRRGRRMDGLAIGRVWRAGNGCWLAR